MESNDTEPDSNCFYVGMRAETMPQCMEDDEIKNITDDTDPGLCQINQKRTDSSEWEEWSETSAVIDTNDEWKRAAYRSCLSEFASHGGILACNGSSENVEEHFTFHRGNNQTKTFDAANSYCMDQGGTLFNSFDGKIEQLQFLCGKIALSKFWVGVTDRDEEGTWMTLAGQNAADLVNMSILWTPPAEEDCLMVWCDRANTPTPYTLLYDNNCSSEYGFICEYLK